MAKPEESNDEAQASEAESEDNDEGISHHHPVLGLAPTTEQDDDQEPVKVEVIFPLAQPKTIAQHYGLPEDYVSLLEQTLGSEQVVLKLIENLQKTFDAPYGIHADHENVQTLLAYIASTLGLEPLDSNEGDGISEEQQPDSEAGATQPSDESSSETNDIDSPEETKSSHSVEEE